MQIKRSKAPENNELKKFGKMLDDSTQCYKFYWLDAIVRLAVVPNIELSFDTIVNEMIFDSWYSVLEHKITLGPTSKTCEDNYLEQAVKALSLMSGLAANANKTEILDAIHQNEEMLKPYKTALTRYVPYRLITPFLDETANEYKKRQQYTKLIDYLPFLYDSETPVFYKISNAPGLKKAIVIHPKWMTYIQSEYLIIRSWIKYKKIDFLQKRNPGIENIASTIDATTELIGTHTESAQSNEPRINTIELLLDSADENTFCEFDSDMTGNDVTDESLWDLLDDPEELIKKLRSRAR